ncbi:hypothetical protein [Pedobacter jamesrossensis]|uniref:Uncharacterized protein n=1 Tax=Pedobacter jamesrossensis TaxID=1908238 RepID=A0ABV8NNG1_9SPHI
MLKENNLSFCNFRHSINLCLLFLLFVVSCKKENNISDEPEKIKRSVLSKNSIDYIGRLKEVKQQFYARNLDTALKSKVDKKLEWLPDWENPRSEIISDTVSYIFYPLYAYIKKDGVLIKGREVGSRTYLIIKNEKEYFKGRYFYQLSDPRDPRNFRELDLTNFSGNLLLANLENNQSFIIDYKNGKPSDAYRKKGEAVLKKIGLNRPILSSIQTICNSYMKNCVYYTYGCGTFEYHLSYDCLRPSDCDASCGCSTWELGDYEIERVCYDVWFPDPPTNPETPNDPPNNGNGVLPDALTYEDMNNATIIDDGVSDITDIDKYLDCFNDGKTAAFYKMTIFIDQPVANSNKQSHGLLVAPIGNLTLDIYGQTFDVGHTFISFQKVNTDGTQVQQVLGFYPGGSGIYSDGTIKDNSGHSYDVSYTMDVNSIEFTSALAQVRNDYFNNEYSVLNYNCTDAGLKWMNAADANFSSVSRGIFNNTPGDFGQALRNNPDADGNPGIAPNSKGPCN